MSRTINLDNLASYIFYILPLLLITGPFLSDLSISILGIYFIYISIKEKKWKYYLNRFSIIFCIFYVYLLISSFLSLNILFSLESSLFYFRFYLMALLIWYLHENNENFYRYFYYSLFFTLTLLIIDGYFQFYFGTNLIGLPIEGVHITSFFGDEAVLGIFLTKLFPIYFALFFYMNKFSLKSLTISSLILILLDVLVFISGQRSAFALISLTTIVIIFCISKLKFLRLFAVIISTIIITLITFNSKDVSERMIDTTIYELESLESIENTKYSELYKTGFRLFLERPVIGHGPKMFRIECQKYLNEYKKGCGTHSHNSYIQLLAETGVVGTIPILLFFLYLLIQLSKQFISIFSKKNIRHISDFKVCIYTAIFVSLWPFAPSMNFFNNWINILYFIPIGMFLASYYEKRT